MSTTTTKERPILFSAEMVRAILEGRKTMTRRLVAFRDVPGEPEHHMPWLAGGKRWQDGDDPLRCPFQVGMRLWVRETWNVDDIGEDTWMGGKENHGPYRKIPKARPSGGWVRYEADRHWDGDYEWRPSIHMPRWASRITLEVTGVRVERLQSISEEDAVREGCAGTNVVWSSPHIIGPHTDDGELPSEEFARFWDEINGPGSWGRNPWVWVISFRRLGGEADRP